MSEPRASVRALIDPKKETFGMSFRHSHNLFGWKAGDSLDKLGLCSGALYRTENFMKTAQGNRCGKARSGRTIHIEHTVPIATLNKAWKEVRANRVPSLAEAYAWMFVHSVTTAVHADEMGGIRGYERTTRALDRDAHWFNRPFVRYDFKEKPIVIWNVLTREKIDAATFSFADHFRMIGLLLEECKAGKDEIAAIRREADLALHFFQSGDAR